jgi:4'-phosphopantetheinyl transferase
MAARASHPEPAVVRVHRLAGDALVRDPALAARAFDLLTPADRARHDRFRRDADRRMFLVGRLLARVLVGRALDCDPAAWTWREGPHGRPEIGAPATALRFNLAHSDGLVACALAWGRDVGVDLESRRRRPPDPAIVDRYCAPAEAADIRARGAAWCDRFLAYWTLKEAYLKARGLGIGVPLADVCFTLAGESSAKIAFLGSLAGTDLRWTFTLAHPTDHHILAVAASAADDVRPEVILEAPGL